MRTGRVRSAHPSTSGPTRSTRPPRPGSRTRPSSDRRRRRPPSSPRRRGRPARGRGSARPRPQRWRDEGRERRLVDDVGRPGPADERPAIVPRLTATARPVVSAASWRQPKACRVSCASAVANATASRPANATAVRNSGTPGHVTPTVRPSHHAADAPSSATARARRPPADGGASRRARARAGPRAGTRCPGPAAPGSPAGRGQREPPPQLVRHDLVGARDAPRPVGGQQVEAPRQQQHQRGRTAIAIRLDSARRQPASRTRAAATPSRPAPASSAAGRTSGSKAPPRRRAG
jgi:hypothetical protein